MRQTFAGGPEKRVRPPHQAASLPTLLLGLGLRAEEAAVMQKVDSDPEAKVRSASTLRRLGQRMLVEYVWILSVCLLRPQWPLTALPPPSLSLPEIHRPSWF